MMLLVLLAPEKDAVMAASPFACPVARPDSSIVAIAGLEDLQEGFTVPSRAPPWDVAVRVYCACPPGAIVSGPDIASRAAEFPFDPPGLVGESSPQAPVASSRARGTINTATVHGLRMFCLHLEYTEPRAKVRWEMSRGAKTFLRLSPDGLNAGRDFKRTQNPACPP